MPFGAEAAVRKSFEMVSAHRAPSFVTVLKRFGKADPGLLSFPTRAGRLRLDFPARTRGLGPLLDELDKLVVANGGRVYLAKDSRVSAATLEEMYPRLAEFRKLRADLDPQASSPPTCPAASTCYCPGPACPRAGRGAHRAALVRPTINRYLLPTLRPKTNFSVGTLGSVVVPSWAVPARLVTAGIAKYWKVMVVSPRVLAGVHVEDGVPVGVSRVDGRRPGRVLDRVRAVLRRTRPPRSRSTSFRVVMTLACALSSAESVP